MSRESFWEARFESLGPGRSIADRSAWADAALAEYDKRFPPPTLDAAMDKAADEEIGKLRALVLRATALVERLRQWVCHDACDHTVNPSKHHPNCADARQWLADCRAEGLE